MRLVRPVAVIRQPSNQRVGTTMRPRACLLASFAAILLADLSTADEPKVSEPKGTFWIIPHTHWEGAVFKTREEYLDIGLAKPVLQGCFADTEVSGDLFDSDAALTATSNRDNVLAELSRIGTGHDDILPASASRH